MLTQQNTFQYWKPPHFNFRKKKNHIHNTQKMEWNEQRTQWNLCWKSCFPEIIAVRCSYCGCIRSLTCLLHSLQIPPSCLEHKNDKSSSIYDNNELKKKKKEKPSKMSKQGSVYMCGFGAMLCQKRNIYRVKNDLFVCVRFCTLYT